MGRFATEIVPSGSVHIVFCLTVECKSKQMIKWNGNSTHVKSESRILINRKKEGKNGETILSAVKCVCVCIEKHQHIWTMQQMYGLQNQQHTHVYALSIWYWHGQALAFATGLISERTAARIYWTTTKHTMNKESSKHGASMFHVVQNIYFIRIENARSHAAHTQKYHRVRHFSHSLPISTPFISVCLTRSRRTINTHTEICILIAF